MSPIQITSTELATQLSVISRRSRLVEKQTFSTVLKSEDLSRHQKWLPNVTNVTDKLSRSRYLLEFNAASALVILGPHSCAEIQDARLVEYPSVKSL